MTEKETSRRQPGGLSLRIDRTVYWFTRHWLAIINAVVAVYVGLPLLAPVMMQTGATGPARLIYLAYSPFCHQMASRSFFLFGDQYAYPRDLAGTSLAPFEAYMSEIPAFAGVSPELEEWVSFLLPARSFVGNQQMGYKTALCERDMAIYGFVLIGGLVYGLIRRRHKVKPLPVWAFLVFGLGPIALDGFSQLLSQYGVALEPLSFLNAIFPLRESSPFLRTLTGAMLGFSFVWLAYPHVDISMKESEKSHLERLEPDSTLQ